MPAKSTTLEQDLAMREAYAKGENAESLSKKYSVSKKTVYRIVDGVERKDLKAPAASHKAKRMGFTECEHCRKDFDRYEGEREKILCSAECWHAYGLRVYPSKKERFKNWETKYPEKATTYNTSEWQERTLANNRRFFPELDFSVVEPPVAPAKTAEDDSEYDSIFIVG